MFLISETVYDDCDARLAEEWRVENIQKTEKVIAQFQYAWYEVEVTFQQCNRPSVNIVSRLSILLLGLAIGLSFSYPGSGTDVYIFHHMAECNKSNCQDRATEMDIEDGESVLPSTVDSGLWQWV